ncbi:unnamed protein product [Heligmosomoides polygyrus]|uniref:MADF domain-containing protein n=1 Tax=Heligmosomoides polygyrus TaxID=6339 RepID=A0A183G2C4_HELPZ|nr:unnamed protein product [Heligmosomoides polygyrus]
MNVLGPGPSISDAGKLKLIDYVREEESIWNPKFPDYIKPDLKLAAWNRVQSQMKSEGFDFTREFFFLFYSSSHRVGVLVVLRKIAM